MTSNKKPPVTPLSPEEEAVIIHKGTEAPGSGIYNQHFSPGLYCCRYCDAPLYQSNTKFQSHCGWPSFDAALPNAVLSIPDADGRRTEIVCQSCKAHLGHVFLGEQYTPKNTRHCVNSLSLRFIAIEKFIEYATTAHPRFSAAVFAAGCFWGVEYYFQRAPGVLLTAVGYTGGTIKSPTYEQVCRGGTQHAEALLVCFDLSQTSYASLAQLFFEIHDPTQLNRQGPDHGSQYRSEIFFLNDEQRNTAELLKQQLIDDGLDVVTKVTQFSDFWIGEAYHQNYYDLRGELPYCHRRTKRFKE